MPALRIVRHVAGAGMLAGAIGAALHAQGPTTGVDALRKAGVLERLAEAMPPAPKGVVAPKRLVGQRHDPVVAFVFS